MRAATPQDAPALAKLGRSTFVETFGHLYSADDLNLFLTQVYSVDAVADDIANPNRLIRVIEQDGELVAYCKLGLDTTLEYDLAGRKGMELKQLYLRGTQQGTGVGAAFMKWALDEARARDVEVITLSVWSENHHAQRFYERFGFTKIADTYFMVGNQRDEEFIYGINLRDTGAST